jgi:D-alanyl-D-alanine carboxypeptidase/D-alanyl-D-alanine-endopeptidase (penicillin-binding protein 4)
VKGILKEYHALGNGTLKIDNGSGLSRTAKLNAKLLATMLDSAYTRYGMRWMKTLSIAGVDGTIKKRFRGTKVRNRAWMKTGTLKRVKNIAGYVKSRNGRYYTTVIIVNTRKGRWKAANLENDIIKWLVDYKGQGRVTVTTPPSGSWMDKKSKKVTAQYGEGLQKKAYYVQAASLSTQPSVQYLSTLRSFGLPFQVEEDNGYKVLIGPYEDELHAREMLEKVRSHISTHAFLVHHSAEGSQRLY